MRVAVKNIGFDAVPLSPAPQAFRIASRISDQTLGCGHSSEQGQADAANVDRRQRKATGRP
jgi:hypothetical protein